MNCEIKCRKFGLNFSNITEKELEGILSTDSEASFDVLEKDLDVENSKNDMDSTTSELLQKLLESLKEQEEIILQIEKKLKNI